MLFKYRAIPLAPFAFKWKALLWLDYKVSSMCSVLWSPNGDTVLAGVEPLGGGA